MRSTYSTNLEPTPLTTYLNIVARRRRLIVAILIVVTAAAVLFALQSQPKYAATSQVLLSDQDLAGLLDGNSSGGGQVDSERVAATQARVARTPVLVRQVIEAAKVGDRSPSEVLRHSHVTPIPGTNVLEFTVTDPTPEVAAAIATAYAERFVLYTRELETAAIERARREIVAEMAKLSRQGGRNSDLYASLAADAQMLRTMAALRTSKAQILRPAEGADKVAPRPLRSAAFGFVAALLLAAVAVAVLEAVDTRVRSETDIAHALGLPLIGRIAEPTGRLGRGDGVLAALDEPDGPIAESFRILRANLEYANNELGAQVIMFTSSVRNEGKSTTVANIAASFARLKRKVVLVDLDFRRPTIHRRFGLDGAVGASDVARGRVGLDAAIVGVPIESRDRAMSNGRVRRWAGSSIVDRRPPSESREDSMYMEVLPAGGAPSDVGEFVAGEQIAQLLASLRERADLVFVDAPPVLEVSDPMTLMKHVDALVVVARLGAVREPMLEELRRTLAASAVSALGLVITGAEPTEGYGPHRRYGGSAESVEAQTPEPAAAQRPTLLHERSRYRPSA